MGLFDPGENHSDLQYMVIQSYLQVSSILSEFLLIYIYKELKLNH